MSDFYMSHQWHKKTSDQSSSSAPKRFILEDGIAISQDLKQQVHDNKGMFYIFQKLF